MLPPGSRVGPYEIRTLIGAGGMGEVYRARDTKLQRDVAIKIVPDAFSTDPERLARFEREARVLASLNHPHIAAIYGFEETDGLRALVLELVEGDTLAETQGLSIAQSLSIARQIAEALEAAHAKGIIHRDLKPANVKVTPDGIVKVLDFGLAKAVRGAEAVLDVGESLTVTATETRLGMIVGTAAYMSPEQARGSPVDKRTDIWAFGCVLYEMLACRGPFSREVMTDTLAAIIEREPEWTALPPATPPAVVRLLRRCLEKDPARRLHDMADVRMAIEDVDSDGAATDASKAATRGARSASVRWVAATAMALLAAAGIGGWWMLARRAHALTAKDTIVLADFANITRDPVFDDTLRRGLSVQLEQSPFLSIVSEDQIQQTLRLMGEKPDVKLTGPVSRQLCRRTTSAAVIDGSISQIGAEYELILKAVSCAGGSLASTDARAVDKNHVLDALGTAASTLRNKLGESLGTVRQFDVPLEQATTPSLEALQAFSSAFKVLYGPGGSPAAIPFFKHATDLDPNFAAAYAMLGRMFIDVGESSGAMAATRKAYELRDRASEREKYAISAAYELLVTGNLQRADEVCALWMQAYPRAVEPRNLAAGPVDLQLGAYEKTLERAGEAIQANPDLPIAYSHQIMALTALNRLSDARGAWRRANQRHIDSPFVDIAEYSLDFVEGDTAAMAKLMARVGATPGIDAVMLANESLTAAYAGRLAKARDLSRQAEGSAERADRKEELAGYLASAALIEALFGNMAEARQTATRVLSLSDGRDNEYGAALALALLGDSSQAQRVADDLSKRFPEDTVARYTYLPTLRAQLALARNDFRTAIEDLQAAAPYDFASPGQELFIFLNGYSIYVRGEAFLAARQGSNAAAEFQKLLDRRGVVVNEPIGVLARLGVARAHRLEGTPAAARTTYESFLRAWQDADAEIPILKQARAEYGALQ